MIYEAFLSGIWASIGSALGKLAGVDNIVGDNYLIKISLLVAMAVINTCSCRYYMRSLDGCSNSVTPTVISAASCYVLSSAIGIYFFEEACSVRWWIGATLIVIGLRLMAAPMSKNKPK